VKALEAYDYLHAQFVDLAEQNRIPVAPQFGRRADLAEMGSPPYFEICADRWFSITHEQGTLEAQWNGREKPAHMQVFADLDACPVEFLWRVRLAWFNFDGRTTEDAEEDVLSIVKAGPSGNG